MTTPLEALSLELDAAHRFVGHSADLSEGRPVFGGQLLAQAMVAASRLDEMGRAVRSVHMVFARPGSAASPLEFTVDPVAIGRTTGTIAVTVAQGGRRLCAGVVMVDGGDEDVLMQSQPPPSVPGPLDCPAGAALEAPGAEMRFVGGLDFDDQKAHSPRRMDVWCRWPDVEPDTPAARQGLAAWLADPMLIPAVLRAQEGLSLEMAHETLSTAVLTHTMSFHADIDVTGWMLLSTDCVWAGSGRLHGRGTLHDRGGALLASYTQDAMVRQFPEHVRERGSAAGTM